MNETDLERFIAWCNKCGHYHVSDLLPNFQAYEAGQKELKTQALRDRAKDE